MNPSSLRCRSGVALSLGLALLLLGAGPLASAQLLDLRVNTRATTLIGDIRVSGAQTFPSSAFSGGAGVGLASALVDDSILTAANNDNGQAPDRGVSEALAVIPFTSNVVAPLRARTILTGNWSSGQGRFPSDPVNGAVGLAGASNSDLFVYLGAQPATLSLTFALEGLVRDPSGPGTNLFDNETTRLQARFGVFESAGFLFSEDLGTMIAEFGNVPKQAGGLDAIGSLLIDQDTGGLVASLSQTIQFEVVPGEVFVVWQTLTAQAQRGDRAADAFSTLEATFSDPQSVSRSYTVPEPATAAGWLAAGALLAAGSRAGRRRR